MWDDADEDERGAALGLEPWGAGAAQEGAPGVGGRCRGA